MEFRPESPSVRLSLCSQYPTVLRLNWNVRDYSSERTIQQTLANFNRSRVRGEEGIKSPPIEFASPYIKHMLGFMGITDVTFEFPEAAAQAA